MMDGTFKVINSQSTIKNVDSVGCQSKWQYFTLKDTLRGELIMQQKIRNLCGIFAYASNTLIRTELNDTIRVIELCNSNEFKKGSVIKVIPAIKPLFGVSIPQTNFDCNIKKTCYGTVSLIKISK